MHGVRTSKNVGNIVHNYIVDGTNILKETWSGNTLTPIYDNSNSVCGINYNGKTYYFLKNLQNDVIAIMNDEGETVARYQYDAWGCCTTTTVPENTVDNIAYVNPFRYRCYYYDTETNLYYLQSRYYDPNTGRFINADSPEYTAISGGNLFAYCKNNPINRIDKLGYCDEPNGIPNWYYPEDSYDSYSNVVYSYDTKITFDILGAIWNFFSIILVMFGSMIGGFYLEIREFLNNNPWIEYTVLGILIVLLIISIFVSAPFISAAIVVLTGISTGIDIFTFDFSLTGIFELVLDQIIDATIFKKLKNYVDDIKKLTKKQKKSIKDLIDKVKSLAQNIISDVAN